VESTPAAATLVSDGQSLGQTPVELSLRVDQVLEIEREGYEPAKMVVASAALADHRLSVTLTPLARARLRASGSYPFEIVAGGRVISRLATNHDVSVVTGQTARLRSREYLLDLPVEMDRARDEQVPRPGTIWVRPPPVDEQCTVFIDGKDFSFPPFKKDVSAGPHTIEIRCPGNRSSRKSRASVVSDNTVEVR